MKFLRPGSPRALLNTIHSGSETLIRSQASRFTDSPAKIRFCESRIGASVALEARHRYGWAHFTLGASHVRPRPSSHPMRHASRVSGCVVHWASSCTNLQATAALLSRALEKTFWPDPIFGYEYQDVRVVLEARFLYRAEEQPTLTPSAGPGQGEPNPASPFSCSENFLCPSMW